MHPMEKAILKILQGNIEYSTNNVPVVVRNSPLDETPCLTIKQAGGLMIPNSKRFLQVTDDNDNRIQVMQKMYSSNIRLDVWCNNEEEREAIINNIDLIFNMIETDNYRFCTNYNKTNNNCIFLNDLCESLTVVTGKTSKEKCPYPKDNHYESFFKRNHIVRNSFTIGQKTDLDELNIIQPVLRTIIPINMEYYTYYTIGGIEFNDLNIEDLA